MELNFKDLNWRSIFLKRYKGLRLTESDAMVILMADEVMQMDGEIPVTADALSQYMSLSKETIDDCLLRLMDKKYVAYSPKGDLTLQPLFSKLFDDFKKDIVLSSDSRSQKKIDDAYAFFQKEMGRPLTPLEVDKINGWLGEGATVSMMQEAYANIQSKQKRVTFPRLEKEILRLEKEKDINKEGYTARDDAHRSNELPKIISHDWLNDD